MAWVSKSFTVKPFGINNKTCLGMYPGMGPGSVYQNYGNDGKALNQGHLVK